VAVAVISLLGALAIHLGVPRVAAPPFAGLRERFAAARDRRVLLVLGMTVLGCLAAFSVFTYIAPILASVANVHGWTISVLLLVYGVGGAIGNSVAGRVTDRWGSRLTLPFTATTAVAAGVVLFVWGLFTWSVNPPIQNWLIELAPGESSGLLLSVNASAIYLGVGLSGVFGGLVISNVGLLALPPIAALVALGALGLLIAQPKPALVTQAG
jgi:predicted MFS family arabinose efflux permease